MLTSDQNKTHCLSPALVEGNPVFQLSSTTPGIESRRTHIPDCPHYEKCPNRARVNKGKTVQTISCNQTYTIRCNQTYRVVVIIFSTASSKQTSAYINRLKWAQSYFEQWEVTKLQYTAQLAPLQEHVPSRNRSGW